MSFICGIPGKCRVPEPIQGYLSRLGQATGKQDNDAGVHRGGSRYNVHPDRFRPRPHSPPAPAADPAATTARRRGQRKRRGARDAAGAAARARGQLASEAESVNSASNRAEGDAAALAAGPVGPSVPLAQDAGRWLDDAYLSAEFRRPVLSAMCSLLHSTRSVLRRGAGMRGGGFGLGNYWKLFLLLPRLLLPRSTQSGPEGRAALLCRLQLFSQGRFDTLCAQSLGRGLCPSKAWRTFASAPDAHSRRPCPR